MSLCVFVCACTPYIHYIYMQVPGEGIIGVGFCGAGVIDGCQSTGVGAGNQSTETSFQPQKEKKN